MVRAESKSPASFLFYLYGGSVLTLFVLSAIIEKGKDVLWINGHNSDLWDSFFQFITHFGEGWVFVLPVLIALFVRFYWVAVGLSMAALNGVLCAIAKRAIFTNSPRPIAVLDVNQLHFIPGLDVHSSFSFPSGHTATIFCAAVFTSFLVRNKVVSAVLLSLALLVGYSRIYLLQHFLIDVAGGACVGIASGFAMVYLFERIRIPAWMSNYLTIRVAATKSAMLK